MVATPVIPDPDRGSTGRGRKRSHPAPGLRPAPERRWKDAVSAPVNADDPVCQFGQDAVELRARRWPDHLFDDLAVGHYEELLRQAFNAKIDPDAAPFVDSDEVFDVVCGVMNSRTDSSYVP